MICDVGKATEPFSHFPYITAHSPTLPLLYLRYSSFPQPFRCFTYVTAHSLTLLLLLLRHKLLTYFTLRASPKFTTGVKYQFHQCFDQIGNPNHSLPLGNLYRVYQKVRSILMVVIRDLIWNKKP